jgi:predicted phosphodiesterase
MTDTHYPSNLGKVSPLLAKRIMDECGIKYAIHCGDAQTRGCHATKELLLEENANIEKMFAPIRDRMLFVEGNHDGAYATVDGTTYAKQLTENEMYTEYFRKVELVGDVHFCDGANAYYIDDDINKVRYICLDTHCVPDDINESDGTAVYNKFRSLNFTQVQFDFLTNEALVGLAEGWKILIFGHLYIHERQRDFGIMVDLLSAYKKRSEYSGSYEGTQGFDAVTVNADFTNAKGDLVGYFCGHKHVDAEYTASNVNVVITRCDAREENTDDLKNERVKGTTTEQSFDVFTVTSDTIYATKIGAGSDREVVYKEK